jgi:hypothetical protein
MGGAKGGMSAIWNVREFTFNDLSDIITKLLNGDIKCKEKLDGQNIMITLKNGNILAARSTKHLKNYGEEALYLKDIIKKYKDKNSNEHVQFVFSQALIDFQESINNSNFNFSKIFNEGKIWANIEILYPETENIIYYGKKELCIHQLIEYDIKGKIIKILDDNLIDELINNISSKTKFKINKTNYIKINSLKNNFINYNNELNKIANNLDFNSTINDYMINEWLNIISNINIIKDNYLKLNLAKRWGAEIKDIPINILLKNKSKDIIDWVKKIENEYKEKNDLILNHLINLFSVIGIFILNNCSNLKTNDKTFCTNIIVSKLVKAFGLISLDKNNYQNKKLLKDINLFFQNGGFLSITPIEGIVFEYKGNIVKLTGNFSQILRIIHYQ